MQTGIANLVHSAFIIASCHCVSRISRKWMVDGEWWKRKHPARLESAGGVSSWRVGNSPLTVSRINRCSGTPGCPSCYWDMCAVAWPTLGCNSCSGASSI